MTKQIPVLKSLQQGVEWNNNTEIEISLNNLERCLKRSPYDEKQPNIQFLLFLSYQGGHKLCKSVLGKQNTSFRATNSVKAGMHFLLYSTIWTYLISPQMYSWQAAKKGLCLFMSSAVDIQNLPAKYRIIHFSDIASCSAGKEQIAHEFMATHALRQPSPLQLGWLQISSTAPEAEIIWAVVQHLWRTPGWGYLVCLWLHKEDFVNASFSRWSLA